MEKFRNKILAATFLRKESGGGDTGDGSHCPQGVGEWQENGQSFGFRGWAEVGSALPVAAA